MLPPEAIELFRRAVLCWLATVDDAGNPSVSPKEIFAIHSPQLLLIAHIASPRSLRNIRGHAPVCVAAIDIFEQHGYQAYGTAQIVGPDDERFAELSAPLRDLAGPRFPIKSVIAVAVTRVARVLAPSLWMYPDVSAEQRRQAVLAAYGVRDIST